MAIKRDLRSSFDPRLVIRFLVSVNLPDSNTLGSIPANATNFLALSNRTMSPISDKIVAASLSPIPGVERRRSYSNISFAIV